MLYFYNSENEGIIKFEKLIDSVMRLKEIEKTIVQIQKR